ncbi:hypothetical protein ACFLYD_07245 [Chloroflexota bacterium]
MDSINPKSLIIGVVVGLILGVLLGMALFWGPLAVEWTDAHSYDLGPEAKADYMVLVADSYKWDKDPARVEQYFDAWTPEEREQAVADALAKHEREGSYDQVQAVSDMAMALEIRLPTEIPPIPPPVESPVAGIWDRFRVPCLIFVLVLLALVLVLLGIRALLQRRPPAVPIAEEIEPIPEEPRITEPVDVGQLPLGHFFTTYQLGEDTYDESFSIEAPTGEFLGECGMGISETIGEAQPDKVTAFEVWLFDKSDIRTVTKVLMSNHAFHDDALRAKLAPKGEAVLAQPGLPVVLETSGLRVEVDVAELAYGEEELPPESFFAKLVVELVAMAKPAETSEAEFQS